MKHIFVNPNMLKKIDAKVSELMGIWNIEKNDRHTIYQMVATIESGVETKVFYHQDGIICDGWNGYRVYLENSNPDPRKAFQGFYRLDSTQMVGWSIYMIANADDKNDQTSHCNIAYGLYLIWEEKICKWGFHSHQDYYTEEEQAQAAKKFEGLSHVKRVVLHPKSETSWMYRLEVETTRKKSGLKNSWRQRIEV